MNNEFYIESNNIYLRPFALDDADKIFRMSRENSMEKWLPDQVYESVEHAAEILDFLIRQCRNGPFPFENPVVLAVCLAENDALIGHAGLSSLRNDVEIGYAIEESEQGHGYATEAIKAICRWGFIRYAWPRILGVVASENLASCRVLDKAGFKMTGEGMGQMQGKNRLLRNYEITA